MTVVGDDALLILNVVYDTSLHQEDPVFVKCAYEFLSAVDFVLHVG